MGVESLRAFRGDTVIYVGEPQASSAVVRELERWTLTETLDIPQWEGIRDRLFVLQRDPQGSRR